MPDELPYCDVQGMEDFVHSQLSPACDASVSIRSAVRLTFSFVRTLKGRRETVEQMQAMAEAMKSEAVFLKDEIEQLSSYASG